MNKHEARAILTHHNLWRRGEADHMVSTAQLGISIDVVCQNSAITQSIRDAAINWPQYLGDVECGIIESFCDSHYGKAACSLIAALDYPFINEMTAIRYRTFMLLVAEALE